MRGGTRLLLLLAAATGIAPFSLHVIAPALPEIAAGLAVGPAAAQLMISAALLATAAATLVLGTLSDRYGRRPVLLWSLGAAALGSLAVVLAPGIEAAVAGRFLQAAGGSVGMVVARAVATDLFAREGAGAFIARLTAVMVLMPMVAPWIGGELVGVVGWRGLFVLILALVLAVGLVALLAMPETMAPGGGGGRGPAWLAAGLAFAARSRTFWAETLFSAFQISAFFSFVGAAPFVMREAYGHGPEIYGRWFVLVSLLFIAGNLASARIAPRLGPAGMHHLGAFCTLGLAGLALLAGEAGLVTGALGLFLPACCNAVGAGLVMPQAVAAAVAARAERAGAASSLLGFLQFAMAGTAAQLAGALDHGRPLPVLLMLWGLAAVSFALWLLLRRRGG